MSGRNILWASVVGGSLMSGMGELCAQGSYSGEPQPIRQTSTTATAPRQGKMLAVVNGELITSADLDLALRQAGPSPVALTEAQVKQMKMEMFRLLIDAALMRQFVTKYAPPASDADIARKLAELEDGLKKQGKT